MNLPQLSSKVKLFLTIILSWFFVSNSYSQSFDQSYDKWKMQQQARDQQLAKQPNNNYYLSRPTQQAGSRQVAAKTVQGDKISLNQANVQQLQSLNGVGEKKALAIVEYREKNGGFKTVDELMNVKGIGPKLVEKNKERLIL
jgi:competence protein ComEA